MRNGEYGIWRSAWSLNERPISERPGRAPYSAFAIPYSVFEIPYSPIPPPRTGERPSQKPSRSISVHKRATRPSAIFRIPYSAFANKKSPPPRTGERPSQKPILKYDLVKSISSLFGDSGFQLLLGSRATPFLEALPGRGVSRDREKASYSSYFDWIILRVALSVAVSSL